jgi:hypothetical protein
MIWKVLRMSLSGVGSRVMRKGNASRISLVTGRIVTEGCSANKCDWNIGGEFVAVQFVACRALHPATGDVEQLDLAGETRIVDGAFSTTDLATGQRKRLAPIQPARSWRSGGPRWPRRR